MATLALTYVGAAIGSIVSPGVGTFSGAAIGGAIGGAVGGYIDTQYLFPALFPPPELKGPRIDDLGAQVASEGSPEKYILGPQNRTPGVVRWESPIKTVKSTRRVGGKGGGGQKASTYTSYVSLAIALCRAPQPDGIYQIRRIWADTKLIYEDGAQVGSWYNELVVYTGSDSSNAAPSPLIESYKGVGNVPRYRRSAYITLKDFNITSFGRIPNFTFELAAHAELSLANAFKDLLLQGGLTEAQFDVTRIPGCLRGYVINGPLDSLSALQPLALAFNITSREAEGKLIFFAKGSEEYVTVPSSDLAAHDGGQDAPRKLTITDGNGFDLPSRVDVKYIDPALNLLQGSQPAQKINTPNYAQVTLDYPITLTAVEAQQIALRTLWSAWAERQSGEGFLPPSYIGINEGDVVDTTIDNERYLLRVSELQRGANQLLRVKGNLIDPNVYVQYAVADDPTRTIPTTYTPPTTSLALLDLPALIDEHTNLVGFYYAVCALDPAAEWRGAGLYKSADNSTYNLVVEVPVEGSIGRTLTKLNAGSDAYWDLTNTVTVELLEGELFSCSELECLNGANRMLVGEEIIGYQTATLVAPRTYTLSKLLRGLRNTGYVAGNAEAHSIGERIVLLEVGSTSWWELGIAGVGVTAYYKAPSEGMSIETPPARSFTDNGATLRPFPPCHVTSSHDAGSGDITINWIRRSRAITNILSPAGAPLRDGETPEVYEIDIMASGWAGTVLRTIVVTGATSAVYSGTDQTTDFGSPQPAVQINIYMRSSLVGRSRAEQVTI